MRRLLKDFYDARVVHILTNAGFPMETVEQNGVAFRFRMRHFNRYLPAAVEVDGAKNRSHSAAGNQFFQPEVIQPVAGI
jgi:hypothetical protein